MHLVPLIMNCIGSTLNDVIFSWLLTTKAYDDGNVLHLKAGQISAGRARSPGATLHYAIYFERARAHVCKQQITLIRKAACTHTHTCVISLARRLIFMTREEVL